MDGKDFWLDAEEFAERYEQRNTALLEEFNAAEAAFSQTMEALATPAKKAKKPGQPTDN